MDDVYCPACRLVLARRGAGQITPRHCPRCLARARRLVTLLSLDDRVGEPRPPQSSTGRSGQHGLTGEQRAQSPSPSARMRCTARSG